MWSKPISRASRALAAVLAVAAVVPALAASLDLELRDAGGKPLADVVVTADPVGERPPAGPATGSIDQIDKQFVPYVSVFQVGTVVRFPNRDNIRHHVYSFSPAKKFDLKLYSGLQAAPVVFDKPGIVVLGCNIHDRMLAYVNVVDTPWFAKSDGSGRARIDNLPPGDYVVKAWHPDQQGESPAQTASLQSAPAARLRFVVRYDTATAPARATP